MNIAEALDRYRNKTLAPPDLLRAILRHERWWIPLEGDGTPELRSDGERSFLTAYHEEIDGSSRSLEGRALVRELMSGTAGVVFAPDEPYAISFDRARLPDLLRFADALDLEDALSRPAPGQRDRLLGASWLVLARDPAHSADPIVIRHDDLKVVPLFTADDRALRFLASEPSLSSDTLVRTDGMGLFRALAARSDYDGLLFDPGAGLGPAVGPSFAGELLAGRDGRPGADVWPSQTIAEIHLWMDLMSVPRGDRRQLIEQRGLDMCAVYTVTLPGWGRTRVAFALAKPTPDPLDLGDQPSRILCGGLLAEALHTRMVGMPDNPAHATAEHRGYAAFAARLAHALERLMLGADVLPRGVVHTARGARLLREHPEFATLEFATAQRKRAEALAGTV